MPSDTANLSTSQYTEAMSLTAQYIMEVNGNIRKLTRYGFTVENDSISWDRTTPFIMVNQEMGIVVKRPFLLKLERIKNNLSYRPKYSIDTIILDAYTNTDHDISFRSYDFPFIFIQPLCDTSEEASQRAYDYLKQIVFKPQIDIGKRNVGVFNGNPVIFDW